MFESFESGKIASVGGPIDGREDETGFRSRGCARLAVMAPVRHLIANCFGLVRLVFDSLTCFCDSYAVPALHDDGQRLRLYGHGLVEGELFDHLEDS